MYVTFDCPCCGRPILLPKCPICNKDLRGQTKEYIEKHMMGHHLKDCSFHYSNRNVGRPPRRR